MGDRIGSTKWGNSLVFRGILAIFMGSFSLINTLNILMGGSDNIFEDLSEISMFANIFGMVLSLIMCITILVQVTKERNYLQNTSFTKFANMFSLSSWFEILYFVLIYMMPIIASRIYSNHRYDWDFQVVQSISSVVLLIFAILPPIMYIFAWKRFLKYAGHVQSPKIRSAGKSILIRQIISSFSIIPTFLVGISSILYETGNSSINPYYIDYPLSIWNSIRYSFVLIFSILSIVFFVIGDIRFGIEIARIKSSKPKVQQYEVITPQIPDQSKSGIIHSSNKTMKIIICERCGANIPTNAQFCNECGSSIH